MTARTLSIPVPSSEWMAGVVRSTATACAGGVVGAAVAVVIGTVSPLPVLVGLTFGLLAGTPNRSDSLDDLIARGTFAVGAACLAGALLTASSAPSGWILAVVAMTVAVGARRDARRRTMSLFQAAVVVGGAVALVCGVAKVLGLWWSTEDLWLNAAGCGLIGGVAFVGSRLGAPRTRLSLPSRSTDFPSGDGNSNVDHAEAYAAEWTSLESAAVRVGELLDALDPERHADILLVDEIRESVASTMDGSLRALERWRMVDQGAQRARIARLETRIADNEAFIEEQPDGDISAQVDQTLSRQRRALEELRRVEVARRTFAFRLQQVEAGLELLQLAVERALAEGSRIDNAEVDALVEALGDTNALFESEFEQQQAGSTEPESAESVAP